MSVVLVVLGAIVVMASWAIASPVGSSPDEEAHLSAIWAYANGQDPEAPTLTVPYAYRNTSKCLAFKTETSAACVTRIDQDPQRLVEITNRTAQYPPLFHWVASQLQTDNLTRSVFTMRLLTGLVGLLVSLAGALVFLRIHAQRASALTWGWMLCMTPLVWFTLSSVNPSSWEIAGAIALWSGGLALPGARTRRQVAAISGVMLLGSFIAAWSRPGAAILIAGSCGFLWLHSEVSRPTALARRTTVLVLLAATAVGITGYLAGGRPGADTDWTDSIPAGQTDAWLWAYNFLRTPIVIQETTSGLGWVDTPMPAWVYLAFLGSLAYFVLTALGAASRGRALVLTALVGTALVFILFVFTLNRDVILYNWQPRYFLPFLAGIPLMATWYSRRIWGQPGSLRVALALGVGLATAEMLGYYQNLLRYSHGLGLANPVDAWNNPGWAPPDLGVLGALAANGLGMITLTVGVILLTATAWRSQDPQDQRASPHSSAPSTT